MPGGRHPAVTLTSVTGSSIASGRASNCGRQPENLGECGGRTLMSEGPAGSCRVCPLSTRFGRILTAASPFASRSALPIAACRPWQTHPISPGWISGGGPPGDEPTRTSPLTVYETGVNPRWEICSQGCVDRRDVDRSVSQRQRWFTICHCISVRSRPTFALCNSCISLARRTMALRVAEPRRRFGREDTSERRRPRWTTRD